MAWLPLSSLLLIAAGTGSVVQQPGVTASVTTAGTCLLHRGVDKGSQMLQVKRSLPSRSGGDQPAGSPEEAEPSARPPLGGLELEAMTDETAYAGNHSAAFKAFKAATVQMLAEMAGFPEECRKLVQFTHAEEAHEAVNATANFTVGLGDVAIGMISGRKAFYNVAHTNVLRYAPRGLLVKAKGKCPCSFRAAMRVLREVHPHAKWYYVGDEDAVINLGQMLQLLSRYDPSYPTMVSSNGGHVICETCGVCPSVMDQHGADSPRAFYGGTGQLVSAGLVAALGQSLTSECREAGRPTLNGFGDLENTCSIASWWKPEWRFVKLVRNYTTWSAFQQRRPSFVVAHHLCPDLLSNLTHVNHEQSVFHKGLIFVDNGANDGCSQAPPLGPNASVAALEW